MEITCETTDRIHESGDVRTYSQDSHSHEINGRATVFGFQLAAKRADGYIVVVDCV